MERYEIIQILNDKFNRDFSEYVNYCLDNIYKINDDIYCEYHHILPRSKFPKYKNESWNIIKLKYSDHINAHVLLADILPIRSFTDPLKFMLIDKEKYNELIIQGMNLWKNTESYKIWREKHQKIWNSQKIDGERYNHMLAMSYKSHNDTTSIKNRRNGNINSWTEERKNKKSEYNINKYKDFNERNKLKIKCKESWDNKSQEEKDKHIMERTLYNKSDEGRRKNSEGLKRAHEDGTLRKKLGEIQKGKKWWTDGVNEIKAFEKPSENWRNGRCIKFGKEQIEKRNKTLMEKNNNENSK